MNNRDTIRCMQTDWLERVLFLLSIFGGLLCAAIGLIVGGKDDGRLLPGGLSFALAAIGGGAAYFQLRDRIIPVRDRSGFRWAKEDERPVRFWFFTITYAIFSVVLLAFSILTFAYTSDAVLGP